MNINNWLKKNSLLNSAIWYTIGTFILKGVNFFTTPIFSRLLSTDDYGVVTIYSTWTAIVSILIGMGINGTVGSAKANLDENEYSEYLSSTLFLGTISFLFVILGTLIFRESLKNVLGLNSYIIILLVFESFFSFVISFVTSIFTFNRNHKMYLLTSTVTTVINIVVSILLILYLESERFIGKIVGGALATILVGLVLYIKVILKGKRLISLKHWRFCLPIAIPLIFHNLSHLVLNQADKIMIQKIIDQSAVGVYGMVYNISAIINVIQLALNSAWMPWYFEMLKQDKEHEISRTASIYIGVFTALTAMFILGSTEVMKIFTGREYWSGIPLMPIIIVGYYFVFLYTFPANYQFYIKQTKFIAIGTILAAICNIVINLFLIPKIGIYGAAISTLIAYVILFLMHQAIMRCKYKHIDFSFRFNIVGVIGVALSGILSYLFSDYFIIRWSIIVIIIVTIGILIMKNMKESNGRENNK